MLEKCALERVAECVGIYRCDCVLFGLKRVHKGIAYKIWNEKGISCISSKHDLYIKVLSNSRYNSLCRKAINSNIIKSKISFYSSKFNIKNGEDLIESLTIYLHSNTICFIPDVLYCYRFNPNSITHDIDYRKLLCDTLYVDNTVFAFLRNNVKLSKKQMHNIGVEYVLRLIDIVRGVALNYRIRPHSITMTPSKKIIEDFLHLRIVRERYISTHIPSYFAIEQKDRLKDECLMSYISIYLEIILSKEMRNIKKLLSLSNEIKKGSSYISKCKLKTKLMFYIFRLNPYLCFMLLRCYRTFGAIAEVIKSCISGDKNI